MHQVGQHHQDLRRSTDYAIAAVSLALHFSTSSSNDSTHDDKLTLGYHTICARSLRSLSPLRAGPSESSWASRCRQMHDAHDIFLSPKESHGLDLLLHLVLHPVQESFVLGLAENRARAQGTEAKQQTISRIFMAAKKSLSSVEVSLRFSKYLPEMGS